jgi:hypothetical protein
MSVAAGLIRGLIRELAERAHSGERKRALGAGLRVIVLADGRRTSRASCIQPGLTRPAARSTHNSRPAAARNPEVGCCELPAASQEELTAPLADKHNPQPQQKPNWLPSTKQVPSAKWLGSSTTTRLAAAVAVVAAAAAASCCCCCCCSCCCPLPSALCALCLCPLPWCWCCADADALCLCPGAASAAPCCSLLLLLLML